MNIPKERLEKRIDILTYKAKIKYLDRMLTKSRLLGPDARQDIYAVLHSSADNLGLKWCSDSSWALGDNKYQLIADIFERHNAWKEAGDAWRKGRYFRHAAEAYINSGIDENIAWADAAAEQIRNFDGCLSEAISAAEAYEKTGMDSNQAMALTAGQLKDNEEFAVAAKLYEMAGLEKDSKLAYRLAAQKRRNKKERRTMQDDDAAMRYYEHGGLWKDLLGWIRDDFDNAAHYPGIGRLIESAAKTYEKAESDSAAWKDVGDCLIGKDSCFDAALKAYQVAGMSNEEIAQISLKNKRFAHAGLFYAKASMPTQSIQAWKMEGDKFKDSKSLTDDDQRFLRARFSQTSEGFDIYAAEEATPRKIRPKPWAHRLGYNLSEETTGSRVWAAEAYEKAGLWAAAGDIYIRLIYEVPDYCSGYHVSKAEQCYLKAGEFSKLGDLLAHNTLSNHTENRLKAGQYYERAGELEKAADIYAHIWSDGNAYQRKAARIYENLGKHRRAANAWNAAGMPAKALRNLAKATKEAKSDQDTNA